MIKIVQISLIVVLSSSLLFATSDMKKIYEIKSGKIDYKITGSGNIMGVKTKTVGKKRVLFTDYGTKILTEENKVQKTNMMGNSKVEKNHKITYMNKDMLYIADLKKKRITRMVNPALAMMGGMSGDKSAAQIGKAMLKKMGGKKIGTDTVLGYTCEVWKTMGTKQCMYKGITLKTESNIMGIKNTEVATNIEFGLTIPQSDFKLPNFPVYDMYGNKVDKKNMNMNQDDSKTSYEDRQNTAKVMQGMVAGLTALAKTGADLNTKELTPEQKKMMQSAIMKAMGGKDRILADMKKRILNDAKGIEFAQKCFLDADTLSNANRCVDKGNQMFHNNEEYYKSWTPEDKQKTLQEIKDFKKSIPCIKAAQSMDALHQCMPEE